MVLQSCALPVLVTRPMPQAARFAEAVQHRYGTRARPVLSPVLAPVHYTPPAPEGRFGAVVFTSETGVRAAVNWGQPLPTRAFCVGDTTARVAQDLGFSALSAEGDADDLFDLVESHATEGPFLILRGADARGDLLLRLRAAGMSAAEAIIYAQEPHPLAPEAESVLVSSGPVVVPLFSPRTAAIFRACLDGLALKADLRLVALSPAVAQEFPNHPAQFCAVAAAPTQAELFLAMDRFINTA